MAAARFQIRMLRPGRSGADHVTWRLLATNNRDLGRSAIAFPDVESCENAVHRLRGEHPSLRAVTIRTGPTTWSWQIASGPDVLAVASRDYQRRIHADYAGGVALGLIPEAEFVA